MHQLTKDILFLVEFGGELNPEKLDKLVDKAMELAYYDGYSNGAGDQIDTYDRT